MYNREVYDEWKLHVDATQYEISYKFIDKSIKILSTKKLLNDDKNEIKDNDTLNRWKKVNLINLVDQYNIIANRQFILKNKDDFINELVLFIADLILLLRKNNIKINDIENVLEPKLFKNVLLEIENDVLNNFYNILLHDIFMENELNIDSSVKLSLKIDDAINVRNTVWNLENLCITFRDLVRWFNTQEKLSIDQKKYSLNIMLIYYMSNFYIKYVNDLNGGIVNYNRIYSTTISYINNSIKDGKPFVLVCFKSIAIFLNLLLKKYNFNKNDSIIENYLSIINIYCNDTNVEKLKNIIFSDSMIL